MDALVQFVERFWHDRRMAVALPIGISFLALLTASGFGRDALTVLQLALALGAGLCAVAIWLMTHRVPRTRDDSIGIIVAITGQDNAHDDQVRADFVRSLQRMLEADGRNTHFQLVVFPRYLAARCDTPLAATQYLGRAHGHFMIFGSVRIREVNGSDSHVLVMEGVVGHAPMPKAVGDQLARDFGIALPRRVSFPRNNDVFAFELTSALTDIAARYVIGLAALVSGDVAYAETLLLSVEERLKVTKASNGNLRTLATDLPARLVALYGNWLTESTRDCRRLQALRGWSHGQTNPVFT
jgi:hypothetical protein